MDSILQITRQEALEARFSRKHIDKKIKAAILDNPDMLQKIDHGVSLVQSYCSKDYYASKKARVAQVSQLELSNLVLDIYVGIAYFPMETLFTSACSQISGRLGFDDRKDAITTVSELLAILCETDAFDITKASREASLMVISRIPLGQKLIEFINNSAYLPPMVCKPLELTCNYSSGYLSHKESLILGAGNHHDGDICLDVLNTMNGVALKVDTDYLCAFEEAPTHDLDTAEKRDQWHAHKVQSYGMYLLMAKLGNRLHLTYRVDKRGRAYAQGYHVNTQGTAFKKATLELANEELITGVPM